MNTIRRSPTPCPTLKATIASMVMMLGVLGLPYLANAQQSGGATTKNGGAVNFREELRQFVMDIGKFARSGNPDFKIIAEDALGLVVKADPEDDTRFFPAKTFIVNIDGVLQREVSTLVSKKQVSEESVQIKNEAISIAAEAGLSVLALEFAKDAKEVADAYSSDTERGIISFVAESQNLSSIPPYPSPIFNANSESVITLKDVKNFLYLENTQGFGSTRDYISRLHDTDYDAIIINVYHGRNPLSANDVRLLKYKKTGGRRLVFATMDITTAASSLYYWKQGWKKGSPVFIDMSLRNDPDRHRTRYWDAGWQSIIYGNANSYIAGIVTLGFDGVVMRGLNGWRYYETGETEEEQDAIE
ncbi:MAG: hypothetical protein KAQ66_02395 [Rhodospirillaceae bacterium]|nr:hypothetical protein [Rhodospirillaceae bacterium]